jgi:hypothetical protein
MYSLQGKHVLVEVFVEVLLHVLLLAKVFAKTLLHVLLLAKVSNRGGQVEV